MKRADADASDSGAALVYIVCPRGRRTDRPVQCRKMIDRCNAKLVHEDCSNSMSPSWSSNPSFVGMGELLVHFSRDGGPLVKPRAQQPTTVLDEKNNSIIGRGSHYVQSENLYTASPDRSYTPPCVRYTFFNSLPCTINLTMGKNRESALLLEAKNAVRGAFSNKEDVAKIASAHLSYLPIRDLPLFESWLHRIPKKGFRLAPPPKIDQRMPQIYMADFRRSLPCAVDGAALVDIVDFPLPRAIVRRLRRSLLSSQSMSEHT